MTVNGIHHVTAYAGDAQENIDFYTSALGLRLVKRTVNFDDPHTYHFYYGDETGTPGTIMTFFPWSASGNRGRKGTGQVVSIAFDVPEDSIGFWKDRLRNLGLETRGPRARFGEDVITTFDRDGIEVELVGRSDGDGSEGRSNGEVPAAHAIRRIGGVTLLLADGGPTAEMIEGVLGFQRQGEVDGRMRFTSGESRIDLTSDPDSGRGSMGVGTVHHVAWRVADDEGQLAAQEKLREMGFEVTEVNDRQYFRSIYFREPGGVLLEVATDPPGFGVDETTDELGDALKLPPWLEPRREEIEGHLPSVKVRR